jgi:hypothetical protein
MGYTKRFFKRSHLGLYSTRLLKGCLFLMTILVVVSDKDITNKHMVTYTLLAFAAMTVIDIYCQVIGDQIRTKIPATLSDVWRVSGDFLPQMVPGIAGAFVFALAGARTISQNLAFIVTEVGSIALMIFFCYASQRLCGKKRWQAAQAGVIAALVGAAFVLLRGSIS